MSQMLPKKKGKTIWGSDMSDFFLWFCERGYCQRAAHQPKTLSAQEGGLAVAAGSAPLGPQPHEKKMTMLSLSDRGAKVGPNWAARGPKGPMAQSLKEYPLTKEVLVPQKGFKTLPKSAGSSEEATKGQLMLLEDAASGKSNRALEAVPKGFGARVSHPPGSQDKQLALIPKTRAREPVQASHVKARGDSPGVAGKVPLGTFRLGYVMLKRTKKPPRQALFLKGPTSAAAHGSMDVKRKPVHRSSESSFLNLVELQPGDLIEIFRFGYQHWAIYVGDGYVIHLAPPTEFAGAGCASLMSTLTDKALVKKELLEVVVGKNRYRVNNKHDNKHPPLPIPKIVRRAEEMVGQELHYKVTSENCEHFVTELRYGVPRSDQVRDALVGVGVAGLGLAALGIIGTVMRKKKQQNQ